MCFHSVCVDNQSRPSLVDVRRLFPLALFLLQLQDAIRKRAGAKIEGGKIIKIEAHPIPENYRPRRVVGRMALVGDAAGYVTKCSGEGIYFAAKSGRMAAEAVVQCIRQTGKLPTEKQLKQTYIKDYDKLYKPTYLVLDLLQKVNELCVDIKVEFLSAMSSVEGKLLAAAYFTRDTHSSSSRLTSPLWLTSPFALTHRRRCSTRTTLPGKHSWNSASPSTFRRSPSTLTSTRR